MQKSSRAADVLQTAVAALIIITLFLSGVYSLSRLIYAPTADNAPPEAKVKSDYLLMLTQCVLGIVGILLPRLFERYTRFIMPYGIRMIYYAFVFCAIFLGEVLSFYYLVPMWDSTLHAVSAVMLTLFGHFIGEYFFQNNATRVRGELVFIPLFAFLFAVAVGALWEIYEFTFDALLGLNMQKFRTALGENLSGRAALLDTMKDITVDTVAALLVSLASLIKRKKARASDLRKNNGKN